MLKDNLVIRRLARSDVGDISRIHTDACQIAYRFMGWDYTIEQVQSWYACKYDEWDWAQLAARGRTPIGFIAMIGGHIDQLFVHPDAQREGAGSALLDLALRRGIRPATLHVFEQNTPARQFYERYGFEEAGRWFNEQDQAVDLVYRLE